MRNFEPSPPPRVSFRVDRDMIDAVQVYLNHVREYAAEGTLFVEQRLDISCVTGEQRWENPVTHEEVDEDTPGAIRVPAVGTSDAVILLEDELQVHDLKYGMGNRVDAEENSQLKIYALAALAAYDGIYDFARVRLVIHQPRLDHLSEWSCSVDDLKIWGASIAPVAKTSLALYTNGLDDPEHLGIERFKAGEHCKTAFCPMRGKCPTQNAWIAEQIGADFEDLDAVKMATAEVKEQALDFVVDTDGFSKLGNKLKAVDVIEDWCKAVRARVESVLIEHGNAPLVAESLGFKLVKGRMGARAWKDVQAAADELKKLKLKADEMYHKTLISPTEAEKLLKKDKPKQWEKIIPLYAQKEGGPSVAPLSDGRPALVITPVAESFDNLEDEGSDLV